MSEDKNYRVGFVYLNDMIISSVCGDKAEAETLECFKKLNNVNDKDRIEYKLYTAQEFEEYLKEQREHSNG